MVAKKKTDALEKTLSVEVEAQEEGGIVSVIRADAAFKKFKTAWERISSGIDAEGAVEECKLLHVARKSAKLKDSKGQFSPQTLLDASAIDLSNRSRMVYVAADLQWRISKLDSAMDAVQNHITANYADKIPARTIDERKRFINNVLKNYVSEFDAAKAALTFIESLIKDIDQTGYGLRNMIDCLKLLSETKGKVL